MKTRSAYVSAVLLLIGMTLFLQHYSRAENLPPRKQFAGFPLDLRQATTQWHGREIGLEPDVLAVLRVDDYMMRVYVPSGNEGESKNVNGKPEEASSPHPSRLTPHGSPVWLYIGYYGSQRTGVTYHSPLNCLPGSGWSILHRDEAPVDLGAARRAGVSSQTAAPRPFVRVNRVVIQKGLDKQLILYWYQDRGRIITSEYWAKGYLLWDAMTRNRTDGALVRVSVPMTSSATREMTVEEAYAVGRRLMDVVVPLLPDYLPV
jgi:EpsI family protein